jgi:hypothetical protein
MVRIQSFVWLYHKWVNKYIAMSQKSVWRIN